MLVDYNDHILCDLLEFGFPIGYTAGDIVDIKKPRNHSGARDFPDFILKYLKKELEYKAVIGPLKVNPFIYSSLVLSPLNSVPKSTPGERRVILDLSFPSENCINAGIDKDIYLGESVNLTYPSVDDFVNLIKLKGRNCGIFKRDLKRAYRQIPIDPGDINFVGFHWKNHIFVDRVLSMGLRSSAHICQRVTSSVVYMMKQSGYLLLNYLDDFAGAEKSEDANVVFDLLGRLLDSCGLEESVEKASSPSTVMTFLGVKFDTSELTISVTTERVEEILLLVKTWLNLLVATVKQLQSLLGKLHFVSNCVRPGRLFVSRLLTWLRSLPDDKCDHIIPLYIRKDLFWWYHFLKSYNGVSMMALEDWSQPDEILETDATLSGCGGWFLEKREFFHVQFPSFLMDLNLHINQFELIALMICVKVWSVHFVNRKILVRCDNQSTVLVLNSGCTRDAYMQCCLREILFYAAKYNFEIKAVHFPGVENRTADILSRWHSDSRFEDLFYELPVVRLDLQLNLLKVDQQTSCKSAFAHGTFENIKVQWRTFLTFCIYFGFKFLPASLNTVCLYAQFLSRSFKSVNSIKNYLNGVRLLHLYNDLEFPYLQSFSLKLTLKGLQRLNPYLPRKALPITPLILKQIYEFMDLNDTQDKTFWSLFLLAFFMMSRKSNLVPNSEKEFDENKQLCRGDIIIENDVLIIILKWSKTIQFGQRKLRIPISSIQGSILCPVNAYKNMIKAIPAVKKDPAFCKVKKGRILPITYKEYQNKLRYLIQKTGRNSLFYSTHSFRRGGATLAFDAEVSTELIQLHGDWHSDAYKKYLEFTLEQKLQVSQMMSKSVSLLGY
ncbi:unnamed protein product [Mytilus edulis]|uniref:Reverse transcriptase domain-containing protein n=1 Tax=Mytilus edulis TaxID=6550 RepID=A0A8S3TQV7_MYTED|nr:unnamed protein product [Mytilus edulis]